MGVIGKGGAMKTLKLIPALSLVVLLLVAALSDPSPGFYLTLLKLPENEPLLSRPVTAGRRFYLDFTHSLDKTPVRDVFTVDQKGILILLEEQYEWYGAGLAFHPKGRGDIRFSNDRTRVLINRPYDPFHLRVGRIANHTLTINSEKIPLLGIADGGDLIAFAIKRKPPKELNHDDK